MNKPKVLTIVAIAAIAVLVISNVLTAYLLIFKSKTVQKPVVENVVITPTPEAPVEEVVEDDSVDEPAADDLAILEKAAADDLVNSTKAAVDYYKSIYATSGPVFTIPVGMKNLKINWFDGGEVEPRDFFSVEYEPLASLSVSTYEGIFKLINGTGYHTWDIKKVGTIASSSDKYAGQNIFEIGFQCTDMGCVLPYNGGLVVADEDSKRLIVLSRYSSDLAGLKKAVGGSVFIEDKSAYIAELENPEVVTLPKTTYQLNKGSTNFYPNFSGNKAIGKDDVYITDAANGKRVFLSYGSYFKIYNENGSYNQYSLNYPFALNGSASVLGLTFNDGSKNTNDYIGQSIGGCGVYGCGNLLRVDQEDLEKIGKFSNGDIAYGFTNDSLAKNTTEKSHPILSTYNNAYYPNGDKPATVEDFMKTYPLVLWKSPIKDYYLTFTKADSIPAVECGKPVIYLYPEKETDVKVQVAPNGGFSITDPIYGADGWLVKADTQSNLYNYADGKNYPYLFWEGKAVYYERPTKGFVVARENVDSFLDEKLAKLGMVGKEIADFKEFWAPKMTEKPYYFVTFLPKNEFDVIAPMKVEPKPQTIIRVFMDYQGLDNPITVEEPIIKTPVRKGFTVVEWGGALGRR